MVESPCLPENCTEPVIILAQSGEENELMKQFWRLSRWIPALIIMGIIFLASSIPSSQMPNVGKWDTLVKKGAHFTGYALLAFGFLRGTNNEKPRNLFLVLLMCGLYSISDEFHQSFVSGRNPSPIDVGIDVLGSMVGLTLFNRLAPLRRLVLN